MTSDETAFTPIVGTVEEAMTWVGRPRRRPTSQSISASAVRDYLTALGDECERWSHQVPLGLLIAAGGGPPADPAQQRMRPIIFDLPLPGESLLGGSLQTEIRRGVRPRETLTVEEEIVAISDEKRTGLGPGHFVTWRWTYRDAAHEVCAIDTFVSLRYRAES
jgi:hypothetical protein